MNTFLVKHLTNQARPRIRQPRVPKPVTPLDLRTGDVVRFYGVRTSAPVRTDVRAVSDNYALCTWSAPRRDAIDYAIISWKDGWRGPHNAWSRTTLTNEDCQGALTALEAGEIEMVREEAVYLDIAEIIRDGATIFDDTEDDL